MVCVPTVSVTKGRGPGLVFNQSGALFSIGAMAIGFDSFGITFLAREIGDLVRGYSIESVCLGDDKVLTLGLSGRKPIRLLFLHESSFPLLCVTGPARIRKQGPVSLSFSEHKVKNLPLQSARMIMKKRRKTPLISGRVSSTLPMAALSGKRHSMPYIGLHTPLKTASSLFLHCTKKG